MDYRESKAICSISFRFYLLNLVDRINLESKNEHDHDDRDLIKENWRITMNFWKRSD